MIRAWAMPTEQFTHGEDRPASARERRGPRIPFGLKPSGSAARLQDGESCAHVGRRTPPAAPSSQSLGGTGGVGAQRTPQETREAGGSGTQDMARAHHTRLPQDVNSQIALPPPAPRTEERKRGAEPWLVTAGILMMLAGVALVVLPTVLPQHAWIIRSLAARGVTPLPIAIGGVLMCGIAFAGRSRRETPAPVVDTTGQETSAAIEALSQHIASLGDGLQGIRIEFVYLKDTLQAQLERLQASASSSTAGDAVYRLAASLDQVGLRIEERFNAGNRDLGESVHALSTALEGLREDNVKLREQFEESARASAAAAREQLEESARASAAAREQLEESARASAAAREQLEETARASAAAAAAVAAAKAESLEEIDEGYADGWNGGRALASPPPDRLGLLDMLDDLGRLLPRKAVPEPDVIDMDLFEGSQDEGWKQAVSIPSALPSYREDEMRLAERGQLLGRDMPRAKAPEVEGIVGDKLEELRDLLADARVREALAALEKGRR